MSKRKAIIGIAQCPTTKKLYGVRIEEKENNKLIATWAFPINEEMVKREGYSTDEFPVNIEYDDKYPGCPYDKKFEDLAKITKGKGLPYTQWAGRSDIGSAPKDKYGNARGSEYDLLKDGCLNGYTILFINLINGYGCDEYTLSQAMTSLKNKGFDLDYHVRMPIDLDSRLAKACQVWLISGQINTITPSHLSSLRSFYDQGKGLYIWGDNDPWNADANYITQNFFETNIRGNYIGCKVVGIRKNNSGPGIIEDHLMSTGIVSFYEGHTIARIYMNQNLKPLVYSTDGNVVTAYSDAGGKRVLIDGGYTRLYCDWNTAGTDRYVVNAAGWLCNFERFGYN